MGKYENVINKVKQKVELTDTEALDMAFICKFIDIKDKEFIIDSLTKYSMMLLLKTIN